MYTSPHHTQICIEGLLLQLTNAGTPVEAKLKAPLALAAVATGQVHALSMSAA